MSFTDFKWLDNLVYKVDELTDTIEDKFYKGRPLTEEQEEVLLLKKLEKLTNTVFYKGINYINPKEVQDCLLFKRSIMTMTRMMQRRTRHQDRKKKLRQMLNVLTLGVNVWSTLKEKKVLLPRNLLDLDYAHMMYNVDTFKTSWKGETKNLPIYKFNR